MEPVELTRIKAGIKMWTIRNYYHDLTEFYAGDEGRFTRMVVEGGKGLATAHPHGWAQHIANCTADYVVEFYRDELTGIYRQLVAWKLLTDMPSLLSEALPANVS